MHSSNVSIRVALIEDLSAIQNLNKKLFEYERQFDKTFNLEWTYSESGEKAFRNCITQNEGIALVAEIDNKIIGYLCAWVDNYSYRSVNKICEIENMFVLEEHRGMGVGKRLVEKCVELAKTKGAKRLKVVSIFSSIDAVKFYKKLGFEDSELILEKNI